MKLFTVGPTEPHPVAFATSAERLPYFRTGEFSDLVLGLERDYLSLMRAPQGSRAVFLTCSGTGAMESSIAALFGPTDRVLVFVSGAFGQRIVEICQSRAIPHDVIHIPAGRSVSAADLPAAKAGDYAGVLLTSHETSTGVLHDTKLVGAFAHSIGAVMVSDGISTFLADPYPMDEFEIDVAITSSHKALGLHPGMAFVCLSPLALAKVATGSAGPQPYYLDLRRHLTDGLRGQSPWTPAIAALLQMRLQLDRIAAAGLYGEIARSQGLARHLRAGLEGLPLEITTMDLSNCLTPLRMAGPQSAGDLYAYLMQHHDIAIQPTGGPHAQTHFRIGHIGNLTLQDNDELIAGLRAFFGMTDSNSERVDASV